MRNGELALRYWTVPFLAMLAWALILLAFASLAPSNYVPRIFQNFHVEHFAAFYVVTLLTSVALPRARLGWIALVLILLAALFAAFRMTILVHKLFYAEDLACDIAGIFSALAPIVVGRLRQIEATAGN